MLKRRKDLPHRRMPVIIFIIPLPSAEMSLSRYSLRSKYIISLKIFVSRHVFLQQKYVFYTNSPSFIVIYTEYLRYLNKERAKKQLLTVNSVNPSCSSALKLYSAASIFSKLLPQYTIVIEKIRKSFIQNEQFLENLSF